MAIKKYNMPTAYQWWCFIQVELGLSIVEIYVDQHSKRFLFLSFNEFVFMLFDHWLYFLACF